MKTVFVIDDDGLMREVLSRLLEKNGYRVRAFQSPLHALPLVDCGYPDAVVSDVQMPGMTGLEFARSVRERSLSLPILLVTATPVCEVEEEALRLDISHVFEKPIKDALQFTAVIDHAISRHEDEERNAGLDRLRLSFLTGLAHELRTPLTAIKLALENLFAARSSQLCSDEGKLLAIGQRNLDRIIRLVEGQLDLLQITLGDVSVARRLARVRDLVERALDETHPCVRKRVVVEDSADDGRLYLFTDPERLRAVIRYLLETAVRDDGRPVVVRYTAVSEKQEIELSFENVRFHACPPAREPRSAGPTSVEKGAGEFPRVSLGGADPFETRAFHRIVASLSGEIQDSGPESHGSVSLRFPVSPRFDLREDFVVPLGSLREAAALSGGTIALLRCRVKDNRRGEACFSPSETGFFQRCVSAIAEGEALVRSPLDGTYSLVLVERSEDEIDHIAEFLRAAGQSGDAVEVTVEEVAVEGAGVKAAAAGTAVVEESLAPDLSADRYLRDPCSGDLVNIESTD